MIIKILKKIKIFIDRNAITSYEQLQAFHDPDPRAYDKYDWRIREQNNNK
jgi:hypothetical protein